MSSTPRVPHRPRRAPAQRSRRFIAAATSGLFIFLTGFIALSHGHESDARTNPTSTSRTYATNSDDYSQSTSSVSPTTTEWTPSRPQYVAPVTRSRSHGS